MTLDVAIVATTAVLALVACIVNLWAATTGPYPLRAMAAARGALAGLYVAAYLWLLAHTERRAAWSKTMVGVSLVAWVIVWIAPAVVTIRLGRRGDSG